MGFPFTNLIVGCPKLSKLVEATSCRFSTFALSFAGAAILLASPPALHAVTPSEGGTPPSILDNVGQYSDATAVYLGDVNGDGTFWAISASHIIPASTVKFGGTSYNLVAGSVVSLPNKDFGLTNDSDLILFRLDVTSTPTGLVTLNLSSSPAEQGTSVLMAGYGGGSFGWGYNEVGSTGSVIADGAGVSTLSFYTFDSGGTKAILGDSGGGVFAQNGSEWELLGIMIGIHPNDGNPITIMGDIAYYRQQILDAAVIPEPGTVTLVATGFIGLAGLAARRKARRG